MLIFKENVGRHKIVMVVFVLWRDSSFTDKMSSILVLD